MNWVLIEITMAIGAVILGLVTLSIYTNWVSINHVSIPPKGRGVSREEFLDALDYFTLSLDEQVIACLQYLGEKDYGIDLSVMYEYSLTDKLNPVYAQPIYIPLLREAIYKEHTKNTKFLISALEESIANGTYTDALTVIEDTIASSLPNYHMRFD